MLFEQLAGLNCLH